MAYRGPWYLCICAPEIQVSERGIFGKEEEIARDRTRPIA